MPDPAPATGSARGVGGRERLDDAAIVFRGETRACTTSSAPCGYTPGAAPCPGSPRGPPRPTSRCPRARRRAGPGPDRDGRRRAAARAGAPRSAERQYGRSRPGQAPAAAARAGAAEAHQDPVTGDWICQRHLARRGPVRHDHCFAIETRGGFFGDVSTFHGNLVEVNHGRLNGVPFRPPGARIVPPASAIWRRPPPAQTATTLGTLARLPPTRRCSTATRRRIRGAAEVDAGHRRGRGRGLERGRQPGLRRAGRSRLRRRDRRTRAQHDPLRERLHGQNLSRPARRCAPHTGPAADRRQRRARRMRRFDGRGETQARSRLEPVRRDRRPSARAARADPPRRAQDLPRAPAPRSHARTITCSAPRRSPASRAPPPRRLDRRLAERPHHGRPLGTDVLRRSCAAAWRAT